MAIQAIARKVVPEDLARLLDEIVYIDDSRSLVGTEELRRIYERRLRRLPGSHWTFLEVERLVHCLAQHKASEVRLVSLHLNHGRRSLALIDAAMANLIFWSEMWTFEPNAQGEED